MATLNFINNETLTGLTLGTSDFSVSRGSSNYYALYYGFTIPAGGATALTFWWQKPSVYFDAYLYIRAGQDPNGVGFGSSVLYQDDDSGGSGSSKIILSSLAAGNYTLDCTTYSSYTTSTGMSLQATWTPSTPPSTARLIYKPTAQAIKTAQLTTYYRMTGYYVAGAVYETWIAVGSPNNTPPSGHTLTNIAILQTWKK